MPLLFVILISILGIAGLVVLLVMAIFWFLSRRESQGQMAADMPTTGIEHSISANFFGQRSAGVGQIRGNGQLALGADGLYFQRILPRRTYFVDYRDIHSVETTSSFLGKTRFTPLLQINFTNDTGEADAMAWQVGDVGELKRMIEGRISNH